MPDYYAILGVPRDASAEDIKRAFRRLARESHPDANPGDPTAEDRFKQVNEAYAVLGDPAKRRQYDTYGEVGAGAGGFGFGGGGGFGDLNDIMEAFFGGGFGGSPFGGGRTRTASSAIRGSDIAVHLTLSFEEAVFGTRKEIDVPALLRCPRCHGEGAEPGTYRARCAECGGQGEIRSTRQTILGTVVTARACPRCGGAGEAPTSPCTECGGAGRTPQQRSVSVELPTVGDGMTVRLRGKGEQGVRGGPDGDLFVKIRVQPHEVFEWDGEDLVCECRIPLTQAVLGAEIELETLDGAQTLRIPPGTQHGQVLKLKGLGVPRQRGGRGDLLVHVAVEVPKQLSREEREMFERIATLRGETVSDEQKGVFRRLRDSLRG